MQTLSLIMSHVWCSYASLGGKPHNCLAAFKGQVPSHNGSSDTLCTSLCFCTSEHLVRTWQGHAGDYGRPWGPMAGQATSVSDACDLSQTHTV